MPTKLFDGTTISPGRPAGKPNKLTLQAKQAIQMAFEGLGGVERLIEWADASPKHLTVFYSQVWVKILPKKIEIDGDILGLGQLFEALIGAKAGELAKPSDTVQVLEHTEPVTVKDVAQVQAVELIPPKPSESVGQPGGIAPFPAPL